MGPRTKGSIGKPKPRRKWDTNTTFSPGSGVGMTCPGAGSLCKISPVRYLALRSFSTSSSVTEEDIHRPCWSDPDIVESPKCLNLKLWVLELEARGELDGGCEKEEGLGLIIKRLNTKSPPRGRLGLAFDRGGRPAGPVGLPTSVLMGIPE